MYPIFTKNNRLPRRPDTYPQKKNQDDPIKIATCRVIIYTQTYKKTNKHDQLLYFANFQFCKVIKNLAGNRQNSSEMTQEDTPRLNNVKNHPVNGITNRLSHCTKILIKSGFRIGSGSFLVDWKGPRDYIFRVIFIMMRSYLTELWTENPKNSLAIKSAEVPFWPFRITQGQIQGHHLKGHMQVPICEQ